MSDERSIASGRRAPGESRRASTELEGRADVRFTPSLRRRLEAFAARLEFLRRRREGAGLATLTGGGQEWVDLRPYREGDDLRDLDWSLLARSDRPFVRVFQREAAERWAILLDTSASMGVGTEGKLQSAAEVAACWCAVGLERGAEVELLWLDEDEVRARRFTRRTELGAALQTLETCRATGRRGLSALLAEGRLAESGRHVVLGDLLDVEPNRVLGWRERVQDLVVGQWLARVEWSAPADGGRRWTDPETRAELEAPGDASVRARYETELSRWLEGWRAVCGRHRVRYGCFEAGRPFEEAAKVLFGLRG
ncbi:MAG: DUF58 domain-containing protein [Planctomycetota bacterium]